MPDESSLVLVIIPICLLDSLANLCSGIILVAAEHLEGLVLVVSDGVVADHLMSHRDGEEVCGYLLPIELLFVVEVRPVEIETRGEVLFCSRIGEVEGLLRCHRNEHLDEREYAL